MPLPQNAMPTHRKLTLFRACFSGLPHAYGTFDPHDGRIYQVKQPVTDQVLLQHIEGYRPYGVYLLVGDQTRTLAVDFDTHDLTPVREFVAQARHYRMPAYIEISKSKGYHVWIFFEDPGVPARKARLVARHILLEIDQPRTEIFPKQDSLDTHIRSGSFIFAPLWGGLLPESRTVFVRTDDPSKPHPDQWSFLERITRVSTQHLDEIIELNEIEDPAVRAAALVSDGAEYNVAPTRGLPICVQRMLARGVRDNQRVSCFRLAVALKRTGLSVDMALAVLRTWACRNRPANGKRIITPLEIESQTRDAYNRKYRSFGCEDAAVQPFCDPHCRVRSHAAIPLDDPADPRGRNRIGPPTRSATMSTSPANTDLPEVFAELIEVLRDLRHAVDPAGPMRPLSIAEAAKTMRCRRSEVESLIENGAMPFINRNGRRYILPSDISHWLRKESVRESPKRRRTITRSRIDTEDIDPALREFFD